MRIFFGLLLASLANFFFGILGFYIATTFFIEVSAPNNFEGNLTFTSYFSSFLLKFLVILILTWIMHRVMTMLDTPKKRILFNPKESVDFNGNTGPFIQYTYARIQSLGRKNNKNVIMPKLVDITDKEKEIIKQLSAFPYLIQEAANSYSPALVANYTYDLVKIFNNYYQNTTILSAASRDLVNFRLGLSFKVGEVIKTAMRLLGVGVPDRM